MHHGRTQYVLQSSSVSLALMPSFAVVCLPIKTKDWSGSGHGYSARFPPNVMRVARDRMNAALAACRSAMEYRRVKLADDNLALFSPGIHLPERCVSFSNRSTQKRRCFTQTC